MTKYAVNVSNLNASMRSLEERVIDFSLIQFQVSSHAFHPTCNHLENLQGFIFIINYFIIIIQHPYSGLFLPNMPQLG